MGISEELKRETNKWIEKLEKISFSARTKKGEEYKENIESYIKDSKHFFKQKDYVKAFEAIIWAWAFFEISLDLKLLELKNYDQSIF